MCRPKKRKKAWKNTPRTLNPSIHVKKGKNRQHHRAWLVIPCLLFSIYLHSEKNTIYMDSWLLALFLCFFSFPFINSLLSMFFSSLHFVSVFGCLPYMHNETTADCWGAQRKGVDFDWSNQLTLLVGDNAVDTDL